MSTQGHPAPVAVFARGGRERAIAFLAFDSDAAKERCYEGVAELAALTAAEMVVLVNDAFMSLAAPGDENATRSPAEDPAARNCIVFTVLGRWAAGSILVPYGVSDDGSPALDSEVVYVRRDSLPWWSAPTLRVLRDETPRTVADDAEIVASVERWEPEIVAVALPD